MSLDLMTSPWWKRYVVSSQVMPMTVEVASRAYETPDAKGLHPITGEEGGRGGGGGGGGGAGPERPEDEDSVEVSDPSDPL